MKELKKIEKKKTELEKVKQTMSEKGQDTSSVESALTDTEFEKKKAELAARVEGHIINLELMRTRLAELTGDIRQTEKEVCELVSDLKIGDWVTYNDGRIGVIDSYKLLVGRSSTGPKVGYRLKWVRKKDMVVMRECINGGYAVERPTITLYKKGDSNDPIHSTV